MYSIKGNILYLILSAIPFGLLAQEELDSLSEPFKANINLIGKSYGDSILLRWAPTTPGAWSYLNKVGYVIERVSFQDENDFDPGNYTILNSTAILPKPLEEWENVVNNGGDKELSAIAAQSLYGKSFSSSGSRIFDVADEFMNRYSFSLLAADLSPVTANALGLRYIDRSVEDKWHYIYRIYASVPSEIYKIDTGYFVLQNLTSSPVPPPLIDEAYGSEYKIQLSWDKIMHESLYSAYYIERSDDKGKTYKSLTKIPFVNPESDNISNKVDVFQYSDSIPINYKPYYYRIIGITPFGEKSPPSIPVIAMGRDRTPPEPPANVDANPIGDGVVKITWEVPNPAPDLDGFYIGRGDDLDKNFQPIHDEIIPKDSTYFIDDHSDQLGGNYYVVAAVDTAGNGSISMVSYAAIVDSIPPSAPIGMEGHIDSTGLVTLKWKMGNEIDLAGYMIYFANSPDHVFSTVNRAPMPDTVYTDTIKIKTLTKKIYYRFKAVDTRWNYSEYSEILELKRPDFIPPTTPVFSYYKATETAINLKWIPSSSEDVIGYDLLINLDGEDKRKVFIERRSDEKLYEYTDTNIEQGKRYQYTLHSVDESGLKSDPSYPVTIITILKRPKSSINNLSLTKNNDNHYVLLNWSYPQNEEVKRYVLYRAVEGTSFVSYKSIPVGENSFKDYRIRKGIKYEYTIKVVYNTGKQTPFSNIVSASLEE